MFLLILESIGTSELILIGLVALIIFGPRKLPELMRTFGKTMAEFRRSTNEFKASWEREVDLENFGDLGNRDISSTNTDQQTIGRSNYPVTADIELPAVKSVSSDELPSDLGAKQAKKEIDLANRDRRNEEEVKVPEREPDKRDWL